MQKKNSAPREEIRIREIRLDTDQEQEYLQTGPAKNTELSIITYVFAAMFLLLAGYLIWFQVARRGAINSSIYNTKQDTASDRIIRGPIVAEDGTQIAYTTVDYTGNETRVYPYYNIFAHVIGYAANGKSGLEASANNDLMSCHSSLFEQLKNTTGSEKMLGDSVVVTLNPALQEACWYALGNYRGAIVVMEPDSGKILAMVSQPDFDPNMIEEIWDSIVNNPESSALLNRATQGLYPPGSIFKILTTLAYLRQFPNADESFAFTCNGLLTVDNHTITCYDSTVHGQETLKMAFANSCNTAFADIGLELDNGKFRDLAEDFLFNDALPTTLLHSESVFTLNEKTGTGDQMTTAIGQGETLVTPLHMALITSAVANGGILMKPYLVSRVVSSDGKVVSENKPEMYGDLMTVNESRILTEYMKETVQSGTAVSLSWNSYSVAGKTGSAEYDTGVSSGTHSWFVGFCNVDDPDIVVSVIAEDGGTGSSAAVPIAQRIFDAYYGWY